MNFKSNDLKEFRKTKGPLIDVRSPDEYYKGHMPNSINIPVFNNEERSIIGKKYKNFGRKSLTELVEKLGQLGLSFGMDISELMESE